MIGQVLWLATFLAVLVWSGFNPKDTYTWILEVFPAMIAVVLLAWTRKSFPLTPLVYVLILLHSIILMVGGHYTYAEVPLFSWISEVLDHGRNNYDKVGHFAQGFVPAMVARELAIRLNIFNSRNWRNFYIVAACLGISAFYEFIEWWVALFSDQAADAFLGTQGYVWDTQSDMFLAMVGAIAALALMGKLHDRQLQKLM